MNFDEYQKLAKKTAVYREAIGDLLKKPELFYLYSALGLAGETGEVVEKVKKLLRDKKGIVDETSREEIIKEMGDVLWYLAMLAEELKVPFSKVAEANIEKLNSRKDRGTVLGKGDNR
ncbi:MAG: nucleoside triphosphate pyrophosphohydrolase family protein [Candidatus Liptonbacteria bacterium]|nr:nucleoside triphosphate pyrophosphohydrolase family protein [Candidatus Liptonbacteria bacterium]